MARKKEKVVKMPCQVLLSGASPSPLCVGIFPLVRNLKTRAIQFDGTRASRRANVVIAAYPHWLRGESCEWCGAGVWDGDDELQVMLDNPSVSKELARADTGRDCRFFLCESCGKESYICDSCYGREFPKCYDDGENYSPRRCRECGLAGAE